jgi:hypothetical protein
VKDKVQTGRRVLLAYGMQFMSTYEWYETCWRTLTMIVYRPDGRH